MVLLVEPLLRALAAIRASPGAEATPAPLVSFSPAGALLRQATVRSVSAGRHRVRSCSARATRASINASSTLTSILELSVGDVCPLGRRVAGAGAARRPGAPAARRPGRRPFAPAGQLLGRPPRLPAFQPARAPRRRCRRSRGADVGKSRRDRRLAARAVARASTADRRPDLLRSAPAPRACFRRRRCEAHPGPPAPGKAIISGFSILCRAGAPCSSQQEGNRLAGPPTADPARVHDRQEPSVDMIQTLEREEIARLNRTIPAFAPGDTVIVNVNVVEGTRKRVQAYEGVVIAKRNLQPSTSSFIVRKVSSGEGVERTFQTYSPPDRLDRGQAARRRAARQALLPARSFRQVGPHQRKAGGIRSARWVAGRLAAAGCAAFAVRHKLA